MSIIHSTVVAQAKTIQQDIEQTTDAPGFHLSIIVTGRVHDDLLIEYRVNDYYNSYGKEVVGNDLTEVLNEFKRRYGWNKANAPQLISFNGDAA